MPYPPRFRVFASSRDLKDLCYWCGRASGRRVIGSCSVIVRLLWNSREHYLGIQDGWWINKYISWLFFKIQKCERKNIFIWWYLMPRGRCDPCQWSCRRCAYEDCIVIELNKPGSTQAKKQTRDGPSQKITQHSIKGFGKEKTEAFFWQVFEQLIVSCYRTLLTECWIRWDHAMQR